MLSPPVPVPSGSPVYEEKKNMVVLRTANYKKLENCRKTQLFE